MSQLNAREIADIILTQKERTGWHRLLTTEEAEPLARAYLELWNSRDEVQGYIEEIELKEKHHKGEIEKLKESNGALIVAYGLLKDSDLENWSKTTGPYLKYLSDVQPYVDEIKRLREELERLKNAKADSSK